MPTVHSAGVPSHYEVIGEGTPGCPPQHLQRGRDNFEPAQDADLGDSTRPLTVHACCRAGWLRLTPRRRLRPPRSTLLFERPRLHDRVDRFHVSAPRRVHRSPLVSRVQHAPRARVAERASRAPTRLPRLRAVVVFAYQKVVPSLQGLAHQVPEQAAVIGSLGVGLLGAF
jgi:hypothetical protein